MTRQETLRLVEDHLHAATAACTRWDWACRREDGAAWDGGPVKPRQHAAWQKARQAKYELQIARDVLLAGHELSDIDRAILAQLRQGTPTAETVARRLFKACPTSCSHYEWWVLQQLRRLEKKGEILAVFNGRGKRAWALLTPEYKAKLEEERQERQKAREAQQVKRARRKAVAGALARIGVEIDDAWHGDMTLTLEEAERVASFINGTLGS